MATTRLWHTCTVLTIVFVSFFLLATPCLAAGDETETPRGNLPVQVEQALSDLLAATVSGQAVNASAVNDVVSLASGASVGKEEALIPQDREQGKGIFYKTRLGVPLRVLMEYLLHPEIPGEALYPNSVRHTFWKAGSPVLSGGKAFLNTPFPPAGLLSLRGVEEEETSPDTSSGCHYSYQLKRLFLLAAVDGRTALVAVSVMPQPSSIGAMGVIVDETLWRYVYSKEQGTNLPMMGWAKTCLYGSATVTVYEESRQGRNAIDMSVFKWARAGWSGMNVVRPKHILDGVKRYLVGFRQIMESPRRPSVEVIVGEARRLQGLDDAALRALLAEEAKAIGASNRKELKKSPYKELVQGGRYAETFSRTELVSDAIKLWMRKTVLGK